MDYNQIVSTVLSSILLAAIPVIGGYIVTFLHGHVKQSVLTRGMEIARTAVGATEQLAKNGNLGGPQKYNIALTQARSLADRFGVHFDDAAWQSLIEHAVAELNVYANQIAEPLPVQQGVLTQQMPYHIPTVWATPNTTVSGTQIHVGDPPGVAVAPEVS